MEELLRTVRQLKDRQDILDCIQRESRARDRQDAEQIAGCWWPEGVEMTADTDATWVYSKNIKGFLKPLWSKDDPPYERPIAASREGVRW